MQIRQPVKSGSVAIECWLVGVDAVNHRLMSGFFAPTWRWDFEAAFAHRSYGIPALDSRQYYVLFDCPSMHA